ncbi:hypothetical protein M0654_19860 [Rhizobium sp. NTR19]|uniref:Uncharacterized protein n=1 Tax=Neorhizobium turbinariae TaxID=2937795 RepID=A0ABT0IWI8_9HYPH|nr:hypothetical protein [Neorhizobium turbinariae]MCK8782239.1 hypothetical protein [Neorhizobium turbinariae]
MQHYADLYALHNASLKSQNVFLRDNWEEIQPQHALAVSLGTRLTDDQKGSSRKKVEGR